MTEWVNKMMCHFQVHNVYIISDESIKMFQERLPLSASNKQENNNDIINHTVVAVQVTINSHW